MKTMRLVIFVLFIALSISKEKRKTEKTESFEKMLNSDLTDLSLFKGMKMKQKGPLVTQNATATSTTGTAAVAPHKAAAGAVVAPPTGTSQIKNHEQNQKLNPSSQDTKNAIAKDEVTLGRAWNDKLDQELAAQPFEARLRKKNTIEFNDEYFKRMYNDESIKLLSPKITVRALGQTDEVANKNTNPQLQEEAEEVPTTVNQQDGKDNLRSDVKRMVDFLPIVKKIKDPNETLDADQENAWTKVPRDWQKLLLGQKAASDPQTQAMVQQAAAVAKAQGVPVIVPPQATVHTPTIEEMEAAKNMFVQSVPDASKEQTNKSWLFVPKTVSNKDQVAWPHSPKVGARVYTEAKTDMNAVDSFLKQTQPWAYNGQMDQSGIFRIPDNNCKNGNCAKASTRNVTPWSSVFNPTPAATTTQVPDDTPATTTTQVVDDDPKPNRFYQIDPYSNFKRSDSILADSFPGMRFKEDIPLTKSSRNLRQKQQLTQDPAYFEKLSKENSNDHRVVYQATPESSMKVSNQYQGPTNEKYNNKQDTKAIFEMGQVDQSTK